MSNKEYDATVWKEIEKFYNENLPEEKKKEQTTWEVEIKNGENIEFHKLPDDPKQRLAALFLSSYLSTTWHKITLSEEQCKKLLCDVCDDNIKDAADKIKKILEAKEDNNKKVENDAEKKRTEGLKKLQNFWNSVTIFLEGVEFNKYDFAKEQTENFNNLKKVIDTNIDTKDVKKLKHYEKIICENAAEPYRTILGVQNAIFGFGIALACDFLKESHFCNIAKPDVHICHAFSAIDGISYSKDLALVKRVAEFAEHITECQKNENDFCNTGSYRIDKIIWRICKEDSLKEKFLEKMAELRKNINKSINMNKIQEEVKATKEHNLDCE